MVLYKALLICSVFLFPLSQAFSTETEEFELQCGRDLFVCRSIAYSLNDWNWKTAKTKLSRISSLNIKSYSFSATPDRPMVIRQQDMEGLTNLRTLIVNSGPEGLSIEEKAFEKLKNLSFLKIDSSIEKRKVIPQGLFPINVSDSAFSGSEKLKTLILEKLRLKKIPTSLLGNNMSSLEFLDLGSNELVELPEDFFLRLPKLNKLVVWNNDLESIPVPSVHFASLKSLVIGINPMNKLPAELFINFPNLEYLYLGEVALSDGSLKALDKLTMLRWARPSKFKLKKGLFADSKLKRLMIENYSEPSDDTELQYDFSVFQDLVHLENLNVLDNHLKGIYAENFVKMQNLQSLGVSSSSVKNLNKNLVLNLPKLKSLALYFNQLEGSFPAGLLKKLSQLESLALIGGSMDKLPIWFFSGVSNLTDLYLGNKDAINSVAIFPTSFRTLKKLKIFQLVDFNLGDGNNVQDMLKNKSNLVRLKLRNVGITSILENSFDHLQKLEDLDLSYNQIEEIPCDVFKSPRKLKRVSIFNSLSHSHRHCIENSSSKITFN